MLLMATSQQGEVSGHDEREVVIDEGRRLLQAMGGNQNCLGSSLTDSPAKQWGWEPGMSVSVSVVETMSGKRKIVIEELEVQP